MPANQEKVGTTGREFGIIGALGMASIAKLARAKLRNSDVSLPLPRDFAPLEMAEQIDVLSDRIERIGREILAGVKADETARRLTSIPGVGPPIAATVRATVNDIAGFKTGRDFAAWLGLTPRLLSSGGKDKLGSISKQGNRQLRTLLVVGATSIIKQAKRGVPLPTWLTGLMARKPYKLVAVALARTRPPGSSGRCLPTEASTGSRWRPNRPRILGVDCRERSKGANGEMRPPQTPCLSGRSTYESRALWMPIGVPVQCRLTAKERPNRQWCTLRLRKRLPQFGVLPCVCV